MYPSIRMMITSQANALTDAQAHPSASSSPKRARRRGRTVPAPSACCAIFLHPLPSDDVPDGDLLSCQGPRHVRVDGADERVGPGREGWNLVLLRRDAGEDVALERDPAARVLDLDVVRGPGVLVLEVDHEWLVRGGRDGRRRELDPGRRDGDALAGGATG